MQTHEISGRVEMVQGNGGLNVVRIQADGGSAEIYTHGAHVTDFRQSSGPPLLFMSRESAFAHDKPIRGGVPLIFPWFGPREGQPMHGHARLDEWEWTQSQVLDDGAVRVIFRLPTAEDAEVIYTVTVSTKLHLEMSVTNRGVISMTFENCLHTYFQIGDIHKVALRGLCGCRYRDQLTGDELIESAETIRFTGETDRVYQDAAPFLEIEDPQFGRLIRVRKSGSRSTVVWNPWIEKSLRMPDFGDDEYPHMLCVESGNVRGDAVTLAPGATSPLSVTIESEPLK
jgi:D-hexose-6-phosphate mutarotase